MKVHQLIQVLGELDSDGEVYVMVDRTWAIECAIAGVAIREDFVEAEEDDPEILEEARRDRWGAPAELLPRNDVFIVVGDQERYGDARAWEVVRRA